MFLIFTTYSSKLKPYDKNLMTFSDGKGNIKPLTIKLVVINQTKIEVYI